jgi:uncharacterized protein (TIGR00369 family)
MAVEGIDDLTRWLGLRWEAPGRLRLAIEPRHMNPAGLLSGAITYTMVDYAMGSALWQERSGDERIATVNISINYVQTAREGEIICTAEVDRRNDRIAVLHSEIVHDDGRLIATAVGSYSIFPKDRLKGRESGGANPS